MTKLEIMTALAAAHIAGRSPDDGDLGEFYPFATPDSARHTDTRLMLRHTRELAELLMAESGA